MIEPLRLSFSVACTVDHAFDVWTSKTSLWWPSSHTVTGDRDLAIVIEPRVGGRILERTQGGVEHEWGEVTVWDPPNQFGYLWYLRTVRQDAKEVTIRFTVLAIGATQIEIEQQGFERLGEAGRERRDKNQVGWNVVIPHFVAACII